MGISQWRNPVISGSGGETRTHNQRINSSDSPVRLVPLRPFWCGCVRISDPPRPSSPVRCGLVRLHIWLHHEPGHWATSPDRPHMRRESPGGIVDASRSGRGASPEATVLAQAELLRQA
jgi:hypothetical protein